MDASHNRRKLHRIWYSHHFDPKAAVVRQEAYLILSRHEKRSYLRFKMAEVDTLIIHIRRLQVPTSYGLPEGGVSRYGWPLHEQHLGYHVCYGRYGSR